MGTATQGCAIWLDAGALYAVRRQIEQLGVATKG
jgi:hypothetical protein